MSAAVCARSVFLPILGHEVHAMEWGERGAPMVLCWHGLARTGRDFDELAARLSDRFFVVCPDTIGRGLSSWSRAPETDYELDHYADIARAVMDHYGAEAVRWIGTSMGGQVGITVASQTPERVLALVVNDIGPQVPGPALDRIVTYSSELPVFDTVAQAEDWLREVYHPFGPAEDAFWTRMAETSVRRQDDGRLTIHYDPAIIRVLNGRRETMDLWSAWDRIEAPTVVLRGLESDLLTAEIAERMSTTGPRPEVVGFPGYGHAPNLSTERDWTLLEPLFAALRF